MQSSDQVTNTRILAEFLVGNTELEQLSAKLDEFNIFRVLRVDAVEIRHSNVLGWLLNPRASHGLSDAFVRRFIATILMDNELPSVRLSPAEVELMDLVDVEVRREWNHIDLLVSSPANHLVVLIENKFRGKESPGQLQRYKDAVLQEYPDAKHVIPVLLTLEVVEPSEIGRKLNYVPWSHAAVYKVATEVIEQHEHRIPQDAQTFLRHYLTTLRRETMQDQELENLCKSIYRKHKTAIDLIIQYGATTVFHVAAEEFVGEHADLVPLIRTANRLWFMPKQWKETMPTGVSNWQSPYPVSIWFRQDIKDQKVGLTLEIGPLIDTELRRKLVETFRSAGYRTGAKSSNEGAKFTRVYSKFQSVGDLDDIGDVKPALVNLWLQSKQKIADATKVIQEFPWKTRPPAV